MYAFPLKNYKQITSYPIKINPSKIQSIEPT